MDVRYAADPVRFCRMTTEVIRKEFLIESLFKEGEICMVYSDVDRAIGGSAVPVKDVLSLTSAEELRADYFCRRRELGVLNVGGKGKITVDGNEFEMENRDCLYVSRGSKNITFESVISENPSYFYLLSYPAHREFPTAQAKKAEAEAVHLGSMEESNKRTIYKYIHPDGIRSC